jgi:hypothetical protein
MKSTIVKVLFNADKEKNSDMREAIRDQLLTGYLSEEIHRKIRRLNLKKAHVQ